MDVRGFALSGPMILVFLPVLTLPGRFPAERGAILMNTRGFTLLELVLVLLLAGLLAALVMPSVSGTLESSRLRSGAAQIRATFALARTLSASDARERSVVFDVDRVQYEIAGEGRRRILPDGIWIRSIRVGDIAVDGDRLSASPGLPRVRFFPDGSAEDAEIVLTSAGGGRLAVAVDSLTGLAEARR